MSAGGDPGPKWWTDLEGQETKTPQYREDFVALVKRLHSLRDTQTALRSGTYRTVLADEDNKLLAFARTLPDVELILVMNYGSKKQKLALPVGRPGQLVGVLTPQLKPSKFSGFKKPKKKPGADDLPALRVGGSRQFVTDAGTISLNIKPMSVRVVIVLEDEPRTGKLKPQPMP